MACSPYAGLLPEALLAQQAIAQRASHNAEHPEAVRRVVFDDGGPIGRIVIDWSRNPVLGVDIAVLPHYRSTAVGLWMLRAWIAVTDEQGLRCALSVVRDNPAARIYARLGFRTEADDDGCRPIMMMVREPAPRAIA